MTGEIRVCCGNCKHFSKDKKHPSTGGCAIYHRMTMRMSWCQKHEIKETILNQKGFTLIEGMIVFAIIGILVAMFMGVVYHENTQCIGGYKFTNPMHQYASPVQILDDRGKGIPCEDK